MKFFVAVAVILSLSAIAAALSENEARQSFLQFVQKYNKQYESNDEFDTRFANFQATLARVAEKNKKSKKATYGLNEFSDLSPVEFRQKMLMSNPITVDWKANRTNVLTPKVSLKDVPTSFDWRDHGAVTPVKDQGQCGSCWAFSVTENIESMWILAGKSNASSLKLAPQQIVDCDNGDAGCNGGDPPAAYDYVINAGGMESNKDYPYTAEDGNCAFQKSKVVASISNWKYATSWYSETDLQTNLIGWGPLSICLDAANWQDYQSGVMSWEECAWINTLDHCVQLVGYQTKTSQGDYWIVRNSWGTSWGVQGYIWLEMWEDTCGLAHEATCSVV